jgi:Ion channel
MTDAGVELSEQKRLAARVSRLKDEHNYGSVLALIVVLFIFADTAPTAPWATAVILILQGLTFAIALWTSRRELERHGALVVLVVAALLAAVEVSHGSGRVLTGIVAIFSAGLTVATAVVIGRGVMRQHEINSQSVSGAIGIYVLLGIFFIFVFGAIQSLGHKPFFVQGHASRPLLLYYSFITMTTVGYGDYTSATQVGKTFAVVEALAGQLYLVTVVAILVSQFGRPRG